MLTYGRTREETNGCDLSEKTGQYTNFHCLYCAQEAKKAEEASKAEELKAAELKEAGEVGADGVSSNATAVRCFVGSLKALLVGVKLYVAGLEA